MCSNIILADFFDVWKDICSVLICLGKYTLIFILLGYVDRFYIHVCMFHSKRLSSSLLKIIYHE